MWKRITEHPTLILITTYVLYLVAFVAGLATIWQFLTDENLPQFLTRKGWVLTMPSWYDPLMIFLLSALGALQIKLTRAVLARRREVGWLEALAEEDSKNMTQLVRLESHTIGAKLYLNAISPYAILSMYITNSSVYPLTLEDKVEQRFT